MSFIHPGVCDPCHVIVDNVGPIARDLDCTLDSVTICPGIDPIIVTFDRLDCLTDSVTICPGLDPIPVETDFGCLSTPTVTSVAGSIAATTLFIANTLARQRIIHNDSTSTVFVKFGAGASSTDYSVRIISQDRFVFPIPIYCGLVTASWVAATGFARLTEVQA